MNDLNWITIDTAEHQYHVTAEALQKMIEEGKIKHLQKGDSGGFHIYVDRDEISGRIAKRSTTSKYKEQTPAAIAGASAGLIISEIYKAFSSSLKETKDIEEPQVSPVKKRPRVTDQPMTDMYFIKELDYVRAALGANWSNLAFLTGVSPNTIRDASNPFQGVSYLTAHRIADKLHRFENAAESGLLHNFEIVPIAEAEAQKT